MKMSFGKALVDEYEEDEKLFRHEQMCGTALFCPDQEVPQPRNHEEAFIKTEIKDDNVFGDQSQVQMVGFLPSSFSDKSSSNSSINWPAPLTTSLANSSYQPSTVNDCLNTPNLMCTNAMQGLKWEVPDSTSQSPFLTSISNSVPMSNTMNSIQYNSSSSMSSTSSLSPHSLSSTSSSPSLSSTPSASNNTSSPSPSSLSSSPSSSLSSSLPSESPSWLSGVNMSDSRFSASQPSSVCSSSFSFSSSSQSSLPPSPPVYGSFLEELNQASIKTNVNGLAGSGGTLITSSFLEEQPVQALNQDLDITDLDRQLQCYDFFSYGSEEKEIPATNEKAIVEMYDQIMKDIQELGIPIDHTLWTHQQVQRWAACICHKASIPDVSARLIHVDGASLCNMTSQELQQQLGAAGEYIAFYIDCHKGILASAAANCELSSMQWNPVQQAAYTVPSPCVSPAPSQHSHSSSIGFSTPSDHSDDEAGSIQTKGRQLQQPKSRAGHQKQTIHLWQFLKELLMSSEPAHSDCIRWIDQPSGIFKIEDSKKVASLWGRRKNRPLMNYDKLSRSVRQYYRKGIIKKTEQSRRLVYQFCEGYL